MRKHYLDNVRWMTVWIVLFYHVLYMFNGVGVLGGIPGAPSIPFFDGVAALIYPWFMVLLFVVAGMSAFYALGRKTGKEFIKERAVKLLVPSLLGPFVLHFITGYLNIRLGGGLPDIPKALVYPISVLSGTGPLWFIQMLFLFSCLILPFKRVTAGAFSKTPTIVLYLFSLLLFAAAQILNMPVITVYRFGIYFAAFLLGYFVFSGDAVQEKVEKASWWSLGLALCFGAWYGVKFWGTDFTADACLRHIVTNLYLWFMVLAVLGLFKKYGNKPVRYMAKSSFGIYILHYPVLMVVSYLLVTYFDFPAAINYAAALVLGSVLTPLFYALIIRIPVIRFLVLGKKGGTPRSQEFSR